MSELLLELLRDHSIPHTQLLMSRPPLGNRKVFRTEVGIEGLGNNEAEA